MNKASISKLQDELKKYKSSQEEGNHEKCFHYLGRAHILSQGSAFLHLYVHFLMLSYSLGRLDFKEIVGQILRIFVTLPGHLLGKVPQGNIGWSTVSLTAELPVPDDLKDLN